MQHAVLIVAAGRGLRAGGEVPKQYRPIAGQPMLERTLRAVLASDAIDAVQIVIHPDDRALYEAVERSVDDGRVLPPAPGGASRRVSVLNGLLALAEYTPDYVHIHDAARPFISTELLGRCVDAVQSSDGVFPGVPVVDALWRLPEAEPLARDNLVRAQTPQSFRFAKILAAHQSGSEDAPDDVSVAVAAGLDVRSIAGEEANFKVTTADDFERAERSVGQSADVRIGNGYDVHAFEDGDFVVLCGIRIPHDKGLKGHSDADVAMHAITDAIYGALAEGDIGQWFPPSESEWKDAASEIFLRHACDRAKSNGYAISNLDCTIVCEHPKIGPHASAMREELSRITGLEVGRLSVKATTSERLGFTGRNEGISAMATVCLIRA